MSAFSTEVENAYMAGNVLFERFSHFKSNKISKVSAFSIKVEMWT